MDVKIKKIALNYGKKQIEIPCEDCNIWQKMRGLMFRKRANAPILLFRFIEDKKISFHSFFVFFPFVIIWLDKNNKVIEYREIRPWTWRIKTKKHFSKVIEIPVSYKNAKLLEDLSEILRR